MKGKGKWDSPEIIIDNAEFLFNLSYTSGGRSYGNDIAGDSYFPWFRIKAPKDKYIDHVLINRVIIYAGEIEYSMLERIESLRISTIGGSFSAKAEEEILDDIIRTGIIDYAVFMYDKDASYDIREVFISFHSVPIDFTKHKEVKMLFDISVKYTTGEEIPIYQELVGLLKMERIPRFDYFYIPYLMD
jgi:hypothetical protein